MSTSFDTARDAFKAGDYARALELTDQAIRQMPNDAALHELRGVVLFALHRYEDAAAPLYAVLSVGPTAVSSLSTTAALVLLGRTTPTALR